MSTLNVTTLSETSPSNNLKLVAINGNSLNAVPYKTLDDKFKEIENKINTEVNTLNNSITAVNNKLDVFNLKWLPGGNLPNYSTLNINNLEVARFTQGFNSDNYVLKSDLENKQDKFMTRLTGFERNRIYRIATYGHACGIELHIWPWSYYDSTYPAFVSLGASNISLVAFRNTSAGTGYDKVLSLYKTGSDYTDLKYYVYIELPNYNDNTAIDLINARGLQSFECTDVTNTWSSEISGKTLITNTKSVNAKTNCFYTACF